VQADVTRLTPTNRPTGRAVGGVAGTSRGCARRGTRSRRRRARFRGRPQPGAGAESGAVQAGTFGPAGYRTAPTMLDAWDSPSDPAPPRAQLDGRTGGHVDAVPATGAHRSARLAWTAVPPGDRRRHPAAVDRCGYRPVAHADVVAAQGASRRGERHGLAAGYGTFIPLETCRSALGTNTQAAISLAVGGSSCGATRQGGASCRCRSTAPRPSRG
jgi:hypothetical protein